MRDGERDRGEKRTETTRQADNGAFQNFGISGGSRCPSGLALNTYSTDRSFVPFPPHISLIHSARFFRSGSCLRSSLHSLPTDFRGSFGARSAILYLGIISYLE